jgi:hypothetical protein
MQEFDILVFLCLLIPEEIAGHAFICQPQTCFTLTKFGYFCICDVRKLVSSSSFIAFI